MCFLLLCQLPKGHQGKVPVSNAGDSCPSALRILNLVREEAVVRGRTDKGRGGEKVGDRETNRHTYTYREKEMGRGWVEAVGKAKPLKV